MTDRKRKGIRRIGRPRWVVELQNLCHHHSDLFLGGTARAGDGSLDFAWSVKAHRNSMFRGHQHCYSSSLRGAHHRLHIVLGEDTFNGDGGRPVADNPVFDDFFNRQQATSDIQLRWRTDDIEGDHQRLAAGNAIDHAKAASGQARVNSQNPHALP